MKKKLMSIIIAAVIAAALAVPALACTPPLNPPSSPHIEFEWEPDEQMQAAIKAYTENYIKEHPIDLPSETETVLESDTEIETETETVLESDTISEATRFDWSRYVPKYLKDRFSHYIKK